MTTAASVLRDLRRINRQAATGCLACGDPTPYRFCSYDCSRFGAGPPEPGEKEAQR